MASITRSRLPPPPPPPEELPVPPLEGGVGDGGVGVVLLALMVMVPVSFAEFGSFDESTEKFSASAPASVGVTFRST